MGVVLGVCAVVFVLWLCGRRLPAETAETRVVEVTAEPAVVFQVMEDIQGQTQWRRMLRLVDPLPSCEGRRVWRESNHGGTHARYEELLVESGRRIVRRIGEVDGRSHVVWDARLTGLAPGTRVEVTETSFVGSPMGRLRQRYFVSTERLLERYMAGLVRRLGDEEAPIL
jgi:hypothetical protein